MTKGFLEDILGKFSADGWAGLEGLGASMKAELERQGAAAREERERQVGIVHDAIGCTQAGKDFVELLLKMTVLRPATDEERMAPTAERYAILKAQREGQNNLVFTILGMLAEARGEEGQPRGDL